ncbi:hypothetical protein [Solicola sp. PLA-1-18]|uniref:hypothetical protein n=1 Tax=Solicola sp. PLA-1-18 TaxID=3380532 RepID=UPI003B7F64B0
MDRAGDGSADSSTHADEAAPTVTVERLEASTPAEQVYLDTVFSHFDTMATAPPWQRWWSRAHEGALVLRVVVGETRNFPQVQRVEGGVVASICRRDIDFADDDAARVVAETNVRHLALTLQELLDVKPPPEL